MRAWKVFASAVTAALFVGAAAVPAAAGGNWIEWSRRYPVAGKALVARNVFFARSEARVSEHGPYFAYLSHETYGWRLPNVEKPGTIRLGRVRVVWPDEDSTLRGPMRFNPRARIRFTVPHLPSDNYLIAFCNRDCTRPLGDVDPTGSFQVVGSSLEARLSRRLDHVTVRLQALRSQARRGSVRLQRDMVDLRSQAAVAQDRVAALERGPASRDQGDNGAVAPWAPLAIALLVTAVAAFVVGRRRGRADLERELERELDGLPEPDPPPAESLTV